MNLLICGISNITDFNKRLFSGIRIYVIRFVFSLLVVERKGKIQATHKGYPQRLKNKKEQKHQKQNTQTALKISYSKFEAKLKCTLK